mmetsp:Transcript_471/g.952  ORF Transcript_471/g.952 Transcript_471/m.952 type:complete len:220 (+) Transcript_471:3848-4507(+)
MELDHLQVQVAGGRASEEELLASCSRPRLPPPLASARHTCGASPPRPSAWQRPAVAAPRPAASTAAPHASAPQSTRVLRTAACARGQASPPPLARRASAPPLPSPSFVVLQLASQLGRELLQALAPQLLRVLASPAAPSPSVPDGTAASFSLPGASSASAQDSSSAALLPLPSGPPPYLPADRRPLMHDCSPPSCSGASPYALRLLICVSKPPAIPSLF